MKRKLLRESSIHLQVVLARFAVRVRKLGTDDYDDLVKAVHWALRVPDSYAARGLPLHRMAPELVAVPCGPGGRVYRMTPATRSAYLAMRQAAAKDGVVLLVRHAYRSLDEQTALIRQRLAIGEDINKILSWIAAPGYSQHLTGRALDIGSDECFPPTPKFAGTRAFVWLQNHAAAFGFEMSYPPDNPHGIVYEPWQWCYRVSAESR